MKYHNWPEQGNGMHTNYFDKSLSWNYSDFNPEWTNMPDTYESSSNISDKEIDALSDLFLAAGIAIDMHYGISESYAETSFQANVMSSRFNYLPSQLLYADNYDRKEWQSLMVDELNNNRPILYCGYGSAGHEFVVDGYDSDKLFHINWGWDGMLNGYYNILDLRFEENDFSNNQSMIIGLEPNHSTVRYSSFMINDGFGEYAKQANEGLNFTVERIESGKVFGVLLPALYLKGDIDSKARTGLAVVDSDNNIVEIVETCKEDYDWRKDNGSCGLFTFTCGDYVMTAVAMTPAFGYLMIKSEIKPGYKLQIVGQDTPDSKWEFVAGTNLIPSSVDLNSNVRSEWVPVHIACNSKDVDIISNSYFEENHKALKGAHFRYIIDFGAGSVELDNKSNLAIIALEKGKGIAELSTYADGLYDSYHANINHIAKPSTYFDENNLPDDCVSIDGIVYKLEGENLEATIIGYTLNCTDRYVLANSISYNDQDYTINIIDAGTFVGNNSIKNIDLSKANYWTIPDEYGSVYGALCIQPGAFSYMNGLESITVSSDNELYYDSCLLHRTSPIKYFYQHSQHSAICRISETLYSIGRYEYNEKSNTPKWYISSPSISTYIQSRLSYSPDFYVPGCCHLDMPVSHEDKLKNRFTEMWTYKIDKPNGMVLIKPEIPEIRINKVYLNGQLTEPDERYVYKFDKPDSYDVLVEYTINNDCEMSTLYFDGFNRINLEDENMLLITSINLNETELIITKGQVIKLIASLLPENAVGKTVTWTSSNESVATVDTNGIVTGIALGKAVITAKCDEVSASCFVTVAAVPAESITLSQSTASLNVGESVVLTATVLPEDATDKAITWTSSNEAIAVVNSDGKVTAITPGEAVITANCGNVSATCEITVLPILVETITVTPDVWSGVEGDFIQLVAVVLPENATDKSLNWTSSDVTIAMVDSNGLVSIKAEGNCIVTVAANDGSGIVAHCVLTGMTGIENIFAGCDANVDVYSIDGKLLYSDCDITHLRQLTSGMYIIRQGERVVKVILK